jgi:hypothetical protein
MNARFDSLESWKEINVYGHFLIRVPSSSAARIEKDCSTVAIRLGTDANATEVLIANFPLSEAQQTQASRSDSLRGLIADFLNGAVRKVVGHEVAFECEVTEDLKNHALCAQGLGIYGEDCWLAKVCAPNDENTFWLLHWNGPQSKLEIPVSQIFGSFTIRHPKI